jgi:hypothetical protein
MAKHVVDDKGAAKASPTVLQLQSLSGRAHLSHAVGFVESSQR